VYGKGSEPDPRFSLANERTFLAWVRASLGLIAGAVAMHSLRVPESGPVRTALVFGLLVVAAGFAVTAARRWAATERAMRQGTPLPGFNSALPIGATIAVVAVVLAITFLFV
jgi:putative membrane protein